MSVRVRFALACVLLTLAGCERRVTVYGDDALGVAAAPPSAGTGGVGAAGIAGFVSAAAGGVAGGVIAGAAGDSIVQPAAGRGEGGDGSMESAQPDAGPPAPTGFLGALDQAQPMASSQLDRFEVLYDALQSIDRPAVGSDAASLPQYRKADDAATLRVDFSGSAERWFGSSGAFRVYTAAHADQHLSLLHAESYGIFANGGGAELSGDPNTYKEFIAASDLGFAWVDYPTPVVTTPGVSSYGEIVLQGWDGTRRVLSDKARYRASVALSQTHVAFVEYTSTEPPSVGQIVVQVIGQGGPIIAVPSSNHQDRPAIDGDWLVFEEYVGGEDVLIRACNVVSGEVRDLSASTGFRTQADVRGTRVVWEDDRSGRGDIYFVDLSGGEELPLITGRGHSAVPRLTDDGLVWIEHVDDHAALMRARFTATP